MRLALLPDELSRGKTLCCEFDGLVVELRPQDFSQAGVFVITTAAPALDRELDLLLRSPIGELAVRGQVVQVISRARATAEGRQPGFGVLFVDLADDQRAWIGLSLDSIRRAEAAKAPPAQGRPRNERSEREQRELAERRQTTLDQLERDLAGLQQNKSAWAMLGLTPNADADAARKAYLALCKRYHPHVYAYLDSPEVTRAATELFIAHKRAYTVLESQRSAPVEPIHAEPVAEANAPPAPKPASKSLHLPKEARTSLRAPKEVRGDADANPRISTLRALNGSTASKAPPRPSKQPPDASAAQRPAGPALPTHKQRVVDAERALTAGLKHLAACRFDEAVREIGRATELCPDRRDAWVWLHVCRARKHRAAGHDDRAQQEYRALLELDPEHREALDHLGVRTGRKRAGLIGKWFGDENE